MRLRVGAIYPDVLVEWVVATLVNDMQSEFRVVSSSVTKVVN